MNDNCGSCEESTLKKYHGHAVYLSHYFCKHLTQQLVKHIETCWRQGGCAPPKSNLPKPFSATIKFLLSGCPNISLCSLNGSCHSAKTLTMQHWLLWPFGLFEEHGWILPVTVNGNWKLASNNLHPKQKNRSLWQGIQQPLSSTSASLIWQVPLNPVFPQAAIVSPRMQDPSSKWYWQARHCLVRSLQQQVMHSHRD